MVRYKSLNEVKDDENQIFVFGPHQYSLYHWHRAYENKKISRNSLVVRHGCQAYTVDSNTISITDF